MEERSASRTALVTALMRARHTRLDPVPLIDDAWGDRLVPDAVRATIREVAVAALDDNARRGAPASPDAIVDDYLRNASVYSNVILRSRYTEDALRTAVAGGIRQYVLIGAGFDSFALRRPDYARGVEVFEVDHPATQELKLRRIAECGVAFPASTHFVAADLGREDLATALARSPFRPERPSFFSWLGVTMYLTREANRASLRAIAECGAPGSELVFTYLDQRALGPNRHSPGFERLRAAVAAAGEPFVSGFDPAALADELRQAGLTLVEDLTGRQLVARYDGDGTNGFRSSDGSHIARARVEGPKPRTAGQGGG